MKPEEKLVTVTLPRSAWMSLASTMVREITDLDVEAGEHWDADKREELRECAREHATRTLPVLLYAVGEGAGPGYPSPEELWALAEELWQAVGVRPTERHLRVARAIVRE